MRARSLKHTELFLKSLLLLYVVILLTGSVPTVQAAPYVTERFDRLSTPVVSAAATHQIGFIFQELSSPVGSVRFEFCSNDALPESPCTAPSGFDASSPSLSNQTGETGFTLHPSSDANNLVLSRAAAVPINGSSSYTFDNIVNPDTEGTYFVRIQTYGSSDGTGSPIEAGGIALAVVAPFSVTTEVPPYLKFCAGVTIDDFSCESATSFFIDLGDFSAKQTITASSQLAAATNAESGYSITMSGTTLTSGNNIIPALATPAISRPGTSQFGVNLRANTNPSTGSEPTGTGTALPASDYNVPNTFKFVPGDVIAGGNVAQNNRKFTVSYITNVSTAQEPGIYATTVSFICLANF